MSETIPEGERVPNDLAAERAVLGGVMTDNSAFSEIATLLEPTDFFHPVHAAIYEAFKNLQIAIPPSPIDQLTVSAELRKLGKLGMTGGAAMLAELEAAVPTTANLLPYARIVQEKSLKRRLITACQGLRELAIEPSTELTELLDESQRRIFQIAERHREGDLAPFNQVLEHAIQIIEKMQESGGGVTGLATGFIDLDHMLTGFHAGELIILAARPGIGKTTLALNIAANAAIREGKGVAVFSLEMPQDQLAMRILSTETRVELKRIREGRLSAEQSNKITSAAESLWSRPIYIDDSGSLSAFELRTKIRRLHSKLATMNPPIELGLIVVDYLQLMHQRGAESRQSEVQEISRSLKSLAKELSLPVLALSQLNRKVEERKGQKGRPMLSDLRESGAIEQDADVVLFIHKDLEEPGEEAAKPRGRSEEVELIVAKQRNGPTGTVRLLLTPEYTRFDNLAREGFAA